MMPTKAELEREIEMLKRQLADATGETEQSPNYRKNDRINIPYRNVEEYERERALLLRLAQIYNSGKISHFICVWLDDFEGLMQRLAANPIPEDAPLNIVPYRGRTPNPRLTISLGRNDYYRRIATLDQLTLRFNCESRRDLMQQLTSGELLRAWQESRAD